MKFDTTEKDAKIHGDVQSNAVSIDTNNINFIVTILSTNLYSKPIESFIRETVSNGWDSHTEAGIKDPVVLELGVDTEQNYFCRIQDFGVGLSPERFNQVYRNIGSSTKRGDNNQIGGFGIGRFSALAYTDVVHITSNFDGKQYKYMMYKDGNSISIDLIYEMETEERNGVQVQVQLRSKNDVVNFYNAIKKQLVYFENLYFVDNTQSNLINKDEFNNFHIKRYKDFLVNSLEPRKELDLVLGKVRYPVRIDSLTKKYFNYVGSYPISLKFEIGDLEVTPNREELLYSEKNVKKIEEVLDRALVEIDEIFVQYSNKDFDNLTEYVEALRNTHQAPLLTVEDKNLVYITIPNSELKVTLKGETFDKRHFPALYDKILSSNLIPISYEMIDNKMYFNQNKNVSINSLKLKFNDTYVCDVSSLNLMAKTYARETFGHGSWFIQPGKSLKYFFRKYLKEMKSYSKSSYNGVPYDYKAIKMILKLLMPNVKNIKNFNNSHVPQSFIDRKKQEDKDKRALRKNAGIDWSQNINVYNFRASGWANNGVVAEAQTLTLNELRKKYTKLTVYDDKNSERLRAFYNILDGGKNRVNIIEIASTRAKLVKNLQNFVKLEDFMDTKYKLIRKIATAKLIQDTIPHLYKLQGISSSVGKISVNLQTVVNELSSYCKLYLSNQNDKTNAALIDEIYQLCITDNYFDEEVKAILMNNLELLNASKSLLLFVDESGFTNQIPDDRINLAVDYVLSRKLFRPSVAAVFKLKAETIFNIKQNESNQN